MYLRPYLRKIPCLRKISNLARARNINVWLVGGFLRDVFLKSKKSFFDFDFCVEKDTVGFVKALSKAISAKFITLDEKNASFRVILKKKQGVYTYDFTRMRGKDLLEDLSLRDFSINMLAVSLNQKIPKVIDRLGSMSDLRKKSIRVITEQVLYDDPLRILRGFAFMGSLNFKIEPKTKLAMSKYKGRLHNVSGERLREELLKIFSLGQTYKIVREMDRWKILDEVIPYIEKCRGVPQGRYHHLNVWKHSLETLRQLEILYKRKITKDKELFDYINEKLSVNLSRFPFLKFACLLHDIGKPAARRKVANKTIFHTHEKIGAELVDKISLRLRLSFRERDFLKKLVFWHLRPGYLAGQNTPSKRAIYRFFRDTGPDGISVIILSLADWRATRGPLTDKKKRARHEKIMFSLIDYYFEEKKRKPLPKIVDGYAIMHRFKLSPSPLVGKILRKIKEEQILGNVSGLGDAYRIAKSIITKSQGKGG